MARLFGNSETMKFVSVLSAMFFFFFFFFTVMVRVVDSNEQSPFVYRHFMEVARTEAGVIRSLRITNEVHDRYDRGPIDLSFITMELSSLLLPLYLNRDYVLYVHTGKARLGWIRENKLVERDLKVGDIYRIPAGCVFYVFNTGDAERLRLIGIMERAKSDAHVTEGDESQMIFVGGGYADPTSVLSGFDQEILRSAFKVSAGELKELLSSQNYGPIVHSMTPKHKSLIEDRGNRYILRTKNAFGAMLGRNKKKMEAFNILNKKPSFHNKYGWTKVVDRKDYSPLKYSDLNIFMVNLTKGTILSPHWNPQATEIGFVTRGGGMVQIVYPNGSSAENMRVSQGDVFVVPQFYPMSQLSFGNESFEFLGFSTCSRYNRPQFLVGANSVLNILNKDTVALGFGVSSDYLSEMLAAQRDAVIFTCPSCAERLEDKMKREEERRRQEEEERRKREEEEKKKKEEERRKKEEEEEEERTEKEEEERRKQEEEERRRKEEEEEEERKKREEEEERREEERRKKEEEERKKEKEEERRRKEEEERRKREEEERREEERRKEEEEERRKEQEEEEERKREEQEEEEKRKEEEEERRRKEEEEEERRGKREEEERREKEEERKEEEKEKKRKKEEEEEEIRKKEKRKRKEEARMREEEEERERERREAQEEKEEEREIEKQERERGEEEERGNEEVERKGPETQVISIQLDLKMVPKRSFHGLHS